MANEKNIRIGDVLLQAGYINQNELDEALEYQKNNKGIRLGEALIKLGFITEHQQLEALSARLGQRYVKIDRIMVQTEAVAMIPVQLAKKYHKSTVQIVLRWHIQMGFGLVPGSKSMDHIKDNANIFDFELTDEEMKQIETINKHEPFYHVTEESLHRMTTTKYNFE